MPCIRWSYGVTTVPERRDLLNRTLASMSAAGFPSPHLFVDGEGKYDLPHTIRSPRTNIATNWTLSLAELYYRNPGADRFCIFQDDCVMYRNLRHYLEAVPYPDKSYLNLYTFKVNQQLAKSRGWYPSNQRGLGAVCLVFDRAAVRALLTSTHLVDRVKDPNRSWRYIDGGIVEAMHIAGFKEYVHNPSLVQHTGAVSTVDKREHATESNTNFPKFRWPESTFAPEFRGEQFDAMELLR